MSFKDLFSKAKSVVSASGVNVTEKASALVDKAQETVKDTVDKAGHIVDEKTGGKLADTVDTAQDEAKKAIDKAQEEAKKAVDKVNKEL